MIVLTGGNGDAAGMYWVEDWAAGIYHTMHKTATHGRDSFGQNVNSTVG